MATYRVLSGKHVHSDGLTYRQGDTITTDLDLPRLFKSKFALVTSKPAEPKPAAPALVTSKPEKPAPAAAPGRGDDVTEQFPEAAELPGLQVYQRGSWCHVYLDDELVSESAIRKGDVTVWLTEYLAE